MMKPVYVTPGLTFWNSPVVLLTTLPDGSVSWPEITTCEYPREDFKVTVACFAPLLGITWQLTTVNWMAGLGEVRALAKTTIKIAPESRARATPAIAARRARRRVPAPRLKVEVSARALSR